MFLFIITSFHHVWILRGKNAKTRRKAQGFNKKTSPYQTWWKLHNFNEFFKASIVKLQFELKKFPPLTPYGVSNVCTWCNTLLEYKKKFIQKSTPPAAVIAVAKKFFEIRRRFFKGFLNYILKKNSFFKHHFYNVWRWTLLWKKNWASMTILRASNQRRKSRGITFLRGINFTRPQ
jgi:hypothetical protein